MIGTPSTGVSQRLTKRYQATEPSTDGALLAAPLPDLCENVASIVLDCSFKCFRLKVGSGCKSETTHNNSMRHAALTRTDIEPPCGNLYATPAAQLCRPSQTRQRCIQHPAHPGYPLTRYAWNVLRLMHLDTSPPPLPRPHSAALSRLSQVLFIRNAGHSVVSHTAADPRRVARTPASAGLQPKSAFLVLYNRIVSPWRRFRAACAKDPDLDSASQKPGLT